VFENPELLRASSEKRRYRVDGSDIGNNTVIDLLSDFAPTVSVAMGCSHRGMRCARGETHNNKSPIANTERRGAYAPAPPANARPCTTAHPTTRVVATRNNYVTNEARTNVLSVVLALLVEMAAGVILPLWFQQGELIEPELCRPAGALRTPNSWRSPHHLFRYQAGRVNGTTK